LSEQIAVERGLLLLSGGRIRKRQVAQAVDQAVALRILLLLRCLLLLHRSWLLGRRLL
jgi:hypothetical protein